MAIGILGAYHGLLKRELPDFVFVGELMLDGSVRGIRGAPPIAPADTSTITAGTASAVARFLVRHCAFAPCLRM
jgi:predicted ATPase with chaperone activity